MDISKTQRHRRSTGDEAPLSGDTNHSSNT